MANTPVVVLDDTMTSIANAIRSKTGGSATMTPGQMPAQISSIPVPALTLTPTKLILGGQSGAVEVKPTVAVNVANSLTSLESMFYNDVGVTSIKFDSSIDLSRVTTMYNMCYMCSGLTSFEISGDLSSVTTAENAFRDCRKLVSVVLPSTLKPVNCDYMLSGLTYISELPYVDTSSATSMRSMFYNCGRAAIRHVYDLSLLTGNGHLGMFGGVGQYTGFLLDQTSVDYLLQTCITAVGVTSGKTLKGILSYMTTNVRTLAPQSPYYQDFLDAGWTIE